MNQHLFTRKLPDGSKVFSPNPKTMNAVCDRLWTVAGHLRADVTVPCPASASSQFMADYRERQKAVR